MPSPALGQVPFLRSRLRVTARPSGSAWAFFASLRFSKLHRGRAAREPSRRSQRPKLFPRAAECMMCWVSLRTIHSQDFLHGRPCTATKVMHHALRSCAGPSSRLNPKLFNPVDPVFRLPNGESRSGDAGDNTTIGGCCESPTVAGLCFASGIGSAPKVPAGAIHES